MSRSPLTIRSTLRGIRSRDIRIAAFAAAIQIGGTLGAASHHRGMARHDCWWASSCAPPTHLNAGAFVLLALGPLALLVRRR